MHTIKSDSILVQGRCGPGGITDAEIDHPKRSQINEKIIHIISKLFISIITFEGDLCNSGPKWVRKQETTKVLVGSTHHDSSNHITVGLAESLDSSGSVDVTLGHNELDVLGVEASLIHGLGASSGLLDLLDLGTSSGSLTHAHLLSELSSLESRDVITGLLSLTENDIGLGVGALVDIRSVDDEQNLNNNSESKIKAGNNC